MKKITPLPKTLHLITHFVHLESSAGIILFATAVLALILNNSPIDHCYQWLIHTPITGQIGRWEFTTSTTLTLFVNDVLMAIFFLLVGLEIKREICFGELNSLRKVALPAIAALGGMLIPALFYIAFNYADHVALRGWAIPTATDIAFALGIISLLGKRVPVALKFYLMALAIFDDLGAILIIAFFYQTQLSWSALIGVFACLIALFLCNRCHVRSLRIYLLLGVVLWIFFLQSGIHPTLAGVLLALTIPVKNGSGETIPDEFEVLGRRRFNETPEHSSILCEEFESDRQHTQNFKDDEYKSPLARLEHTLHPWVAYGILPLFSFVNAGMSFAGLQITELFGTISSGIVMGLFFGKQLGVFIATWLAIRSGVAPMPEGASWGSLYAIAIICGVGFTMSLFIGNLAFTETDTSHIALVKLGILTGSLLAGIAGYWLLRRCCRQTAA
jgi:NhaA family Na+:H+ antiporter